MNKSSSLIHVMLVLKQEKLFRNLKKCTFFSHELYFLGYIVTGCRIKANESKLEAIRTWPILQSIHDVQSFNGLASFDRRFMRNFTTIMAPVNTPKAQYAFKEVKKKLTQALVLELPCFDKVFEVEREASGVGIGGVSTEEGKPLAFFSGKLCDSRRKYSTYDKEFYAIVRCSEH